MSKLGCNDIMLIKGDKNPSFIVMDFDWQKWDNAVPLCCFCRLQRISFLTFVRFVVSLSKVLKL